MTIQVNCTIRDYAPATDTCSVEIQGIGIIDSWVDGVQIAPPVNRGYVTFGAPGLLSMPDEHRICEAILTQVTPANNQISVYNGATPAAGTQQKILTGRTQIQTDGAGNGAVALTFTSPFLTIPSISVMADAFRKIDVSAITVNGFTATLHVATTPNFYVNFSWGAYGT